MEICKNILFLSIILFLASCAELLKPEEPVKPVGIIPPVRDTVKFSDNPNLGTFNDKKYRRSTRKTLEDENEVHSRAGSLWNTEGQGAFLFTQNKARREGDLLNVKLEGAGKSQVETKIKIIKKLLARLETPAVPNLTNDPKANEEQRGLASVANGNLASGSSAEASQNKNKDEVKTVTASPVLKPGVAQTVPASEDEQPNQVEAIPARVVERLADGNYRVKGVQPFMIGKREYKVIMTGFVRPEDFSDEGVNSGKILDPQWDVVSLRRVQ
jgi:flagellar L-ring protein precursor FlgH